MPTPKLHSVCHPYANKWCYHTFCDGSPLLTPLYRPLVCLPPLLPHSIPSPDLTLSPLTPLLPHSIPSPDLIYSPRRPPSNVSLPTYILNS